MPENYQVYPSRKLWVVARNARGSAEHHLLGLKAGKRKAGRGKRKAK